MKSRFSSVFIDKDLSAESAKERGKLRATYKKAKSNESLLEATNSLLIVAVIQ